MGDLFLLVESATSVQGVRLVMTKLVLTFESLLSGSGAGPGTFLNLTV